jgi:hypothetical protein
MRLPVIALVVAQSFHVFLGGKPGMTVKYALGEAASLLARPSCAQVFDDFRDPDGWPLSRALDASGKTPKQRLSELYFAEADLARCSADGRMVAYTAPGSRVIWICGQRFAESFAASVHGGAVLLIHELLHTAGLGENPPSSGAITAAVAQRCR